MEKEVDAMSMSTRMDGRASIEHQIDIHVLDLAQLGDYSLHDILHGLQYVMQYRIKGLKMKQLDQGIMSRLCESLLANMITKEGSLAFLKTTPDADLAFSLFAEFLNEVDEFRIAVSKISSTDLLHTLKIHRHVKSSNQQERLFALSILSILTTQFPQFSDWKDLVKEKEWENVEEAFEEYKKSNVVSHVIDPASVFPPHCMSC